VTRVAVSGHRGITPEVSGLIRDGIDSALAELAPNGTDLIGLTCLADGADQIFASAVMDRGGSIEVIVPSDGYREALPDTAKPVYDELISQASKVRYCDHRESTPTAHMDASRLMLDTAEHLIAVWDGKPARGYGGTADVVQDAHNRGLPVSIVWPTGAFRD
jgi:hypothetical protein